MSETIQIWKARNKKGIIISKELHDQLFEFIIEKLKSKNGITLIELIEMANEEFFKNSFESGSWWLLNVKQNMEVTGVITVHRIPGHSQFITLKVKGRKKI